ncbi:MULTISPECIES: trans-aconitate 2-methyltransferase [unclassified Streptomyces]|uniref:class I SAM-dependent methyltransferase n=1 Tax=unclassified Streptomyces TaxID=2593676 RepID=UPI001F04A882|nr:MULTISPECIES: class I SAM-dependent methyltransferase [unclassified Streptomyces]MCH0563482.1 class I SAM-dependent methyltransferase [Streptomyces sp. MUM 2J]MCH0570178.1 class I SAM-dependent methyltransferase [Streptomyces sp. MUM 136J]
MTTRTERYGDQIFSHTGADERARLSALADVLDPVSVDALAAPASGPVRRCLELAAGTGSVALRMLDLFPSAHVTATELDLRFLEEIRGDRLDVLRHDITTDEFPDGSFDVIHVRYLLHHLPTRAEVFARIVRWLAPGGRLVIEEPALFSLEAARDETYRRVSLGALQVLTDRLGTDCTRWGLDLPHTAAAHGLTDVSLRTTVPTVAHNTPMGRFWRLTLDHLGPGIAELPGVLPGDVPAVLDRLSRPGPVEMGMATVTVTATKPAF